MSSEQEQELIRAAERVFSGPSAYRRCYSEEELRVHPDLMHDLEEIARHYLATRKAEPVAITEDFWMSHGFKYVGSKLCRVAYGVDVDVRKVRDGAPFWVATISKFDWPLAFENTKQACGLLAALGIEVKA